MASSILVSTILGSLLVTAKVHSQGDQFSIQPEMVDRGNSQTLSLLKGYLNTNPTGVGGAEISIVDGIALDPVVDEGGAFVDLGHSGTGQISTYKVRPGDTISEIADMFGVSVNTIIWANNLRGSSIRVGQELVILPITGVRHIVKKGDTVGSIVKKYKADMQDVLIYNDLTENSNIAVGDVIIVPNGIESAASAAAVVARTTSSNAPVVSAGYFIRPIRGGVRSQGIHGYNAVDLAAPVGTPIMASAEGTVIIARTSGYNGGYGLYVAIKHPNGTQTVYGHMSQVNVRVGQYVGQGDVIGAVGNTGHSTGPHIHFEIRGAKNPF